MVNYMQLISADLVGIVTLMDAYGGQTCTKLISVAIRSSVLSFLYTPKIPVRKETDSETDQLQGSKVYSARHR